MDDKRDFTAVNLAFNVAAMRDVFKDVGECNPGGSYICTTGTKTCDAGLTCVGTSTHVFECAAASEDVLDLGLDAHILVQREELKMLQRELQEVVMRFGRGAAQG